MDYFRHIWIYSESEPLIFTRLFFWGFFAVVLAVYSLIYKRISLRNLYLFLVSLFFYYKTSGLFVSILLFSTLADYQIGKWLYKTEHEAGRKWLVAASVFVNLLLLGYFKYAHFFTENINAIFGTHFHVINHFALMANAFTGSHFEVGKILLPVGISFFTFQTISYTVDIYRKQVKPVKNILDFGFYVSFFPQLVSGPIVRASEFVPQLYREFQLSKEEFGLAVFWILNGLIKKLFIGDYIAVNFIDRVFDNPYSYSGFEALMSLYGYSLQVYCDFSGYTDIAIGVALLMGFRLPVNFNSPYKARNVGDFWKRWHMSLSSWLKDYLYIPMGGNRGGSLFTFFSIVFIIICLVLLTGMLSLALGFLLLTGICLLLFRFFPRFKLVLSNHINLMVTMLLGGLWHGASWQFVIWGGLNGLGLVVYKFWRKISPWENKKGWLVRFWTIFITFHFITFTRIWFRGTDPANSNAILYQITHHFNWEIIPSVLLSFKSVFIIMSLGFVVHWIPAGGKQWYRERFVATPVWLKACVVVIVVFILYQSVSAGLQPFIYFQF